VPVVFNDEPEQSWQSDSYLEARENFTVACARAGFEVESHKHPDLGPNGELLYCDVAWVGPRNACKLLLMVSGVHGVESFSGSATQVGWIEQGRYRQLPADTAVLMVHQINPWGAAHLRRYNEDNVDLCRNFLDFSQALPENSAYANEHERLVLGEMMGERGEKTGPYLGAKLQELSLESLVDLFMGGQHDFSDGFSFGGTEAVWSNTLLRNILASYNQTVKKVCVIEFHTGLGPWAYGTLITMHQGEELERVRRWFGPWAFNPSADKSPGEDGYRVVNGHTIEAYKTGFPAAEVTAVTLEFGTYPSDETLMLLLQEHMLVQHSGELDAELMAEVKTRLLEYHHPKNWEWRCSFWDRSLQMIRQGIQGLNQ
jgi:hypothetical protein|tara:strand:- start:3904 stop:5016 length:1113 start_codon:yes stop_codon:yes gene_type:complete